MSTELDKAREALQSFDATRDSYEDARTRDDRTYLLSMLDNHDAHDVDHLRAALEEVDRLTAALAEAEATIANERGEGEPPEPGWKGRPQGPGLGYWVNHRLGIGTHVTPNETCDGATGKWSRVWHAAIGGGVVIAEAPTARACMRAAVATLKETP